MKCVEWGTFGMFPSAQRKANFTCQQSSFIAHKELGRCRRIKSKFSCRWFEQPNILCTSEELRSVEFFSGVYHPQDTQDEKVSSPCSPRGTEDRTNFFISGVLGVIDPRKKSVRKRSSKVRQMLECWKFKYENCIFIRECLLCTNLHIITVL